MLAHVHVHTEASTTLIHCVQWTLDTLYTEHYTLDTGYCTLDTLYFVVSYTVLSSV